jgi:hypothetical protein
LSLSDFRELYERHVQSVADGDVTAALADMIQENLPAVFDGVTVPRGKVLSHRIVTARAEGDRRIGEAVYVTAEEGAIGLRSEWERQGGGWKAAALSNFSAEEVSGDE